MPNTTQQVINGHVYSWSSIEIETAGLVFAGVKEINYGDSVKVGKVYGSDGTLVGGTPGKSTPSMELVMYRRDWDQLRTALAGMSGYVGVFSTKFVTVRVAYAEKALPNVENSESPTVTDFIEHVRLVGPSSKNSVGSDPSTVAIACEPTIIRWGASAGKKGHTAMPEFSAGDPPTYGPPTEAKAGEFNSGLSTGTFWSPDPPEGFWGEDYAVNPFDSVVLAGEKLPGICKVSGTPSVMIERQRPNGRDAAALIRRGYQQPEIEIEMLIWTPAHWGIWQGMQLKFWRKPNKSGTFEEPKTNPVPKVGQSKTVTQQENIQKAQQANAIIAREQQAIRTSKVATVENAISIYHPALAPLGICNVILESISAPVDGPEPQTKIVKIKCIEHIAAGVANVVRKTKGTATKASTPDPTVAKPLQKTPGETQGGPG